jgi:hypothetical protein
MLAKKLGRTTCRGLIHLFSPLISFLLVSHEVTKDLFHYATINKSSKRLFLNIMMTNKLPHHAATLPGICDYLATSHRYGIRNRCLYRLRLVLPYKDITNLRIGSVLNRDGTIVDEIHGDGWTLTVDDDLADDLLNYIRERYQRYDLANYIFIRGHDHLFRTQKSSSFSHGWLAQLYTHLDRSIRRYFTSLERPTKRR